MLVKVTKNTVRVLDANIDSTSKVELLAKLEENIARKQKFLIVTPNPEIIMLAQKDVALSKILNLATFSIPDGIGVVAASRFLSLPNPKDILLRLPVLILQGLGVAVSIFFDQDWLTSDLKVIKGRELFVDLVKTANNNGWKVFLLGGTDGVSGKAAKVLREKYKKVKIKALDGPMLNINAVPISKTEQKVEKDAIEQINKFTPHLLFVGFGAPKQEKWIAKKLFKLRVGGAMVVGGTFDYVGGKTQLPPSWVEKLHLEWLWRILTGSQKLSRVIKAVILFPLAVFWSKLNADSC